MQNGIEKGLVRREVFGSALALAGCALATPALATGALLPEPLSAPNPVDPVLLRRALNALERHSGDIARRDRIAIVDFAAASSRPRFHFVDLASGRTTSLFVAHGSGSDPQHTGWLQQFSNMPGSNASSSGAYVTSNYYIGKHGRSQRLIGLDPTNDNALDRAIVIHGAWYAAPALVAAQGMLGRSQGCFAVDDTVLGDVFDQLGEGRMLYADKIETA